MENLKQFIIRHFEKIVVVVIFLAAFLSTYFIREKNLLLNFYYLPVVLAAYYLGRRLGVLTALLSILLVLVFCIVFPQSFYFNKEVLERSLMLTSWGGFLILTSFAVGTLYEQKELKIQELKQAYIGVLEILSKYIESTDRYTRGHSVRVSKLAMEIAIAMELPRDVVENVRVAGLLHDIGKIEVSSQVLRKASELSLEEREEVDAHSLKGAYLLSKVGVILKEVVPIVIAHHSYFVETIEGDANLLKKIPLGARIVAVADAFDAMTTDRPYRKGKAPWEALQEIATQAGKQFDPRVIEAFKRVVGERLETI